MWLQAVMFSPLHLFELSFLVWESLLNVRNSYGSQCTLYHSVLKGGQEPLKLLGVKAIFITVLKHTCTWVCSGVFQRQHDVQRMEGRDRECGIYMYTLLYLKWTANRDLLYITRNSAQCYVAACTGREFRGEWIHVCVWLSPFAVYLKPLQHC